MHGLLPRLLRRATPTLIPVSGLVAVVAALSGGAATPTPLLAQNDSLQELAESAVRGVVLIDVVTAADTRQGSGFLVDSTGRILTNEHVVRNAQSIRVKLTSGDVYDAVDVLATDERRDIAVLRIAGFNLPALPLGDSDSVRIGTPVVLIGSPLGLENTVTTGIVSARRQEEQGYTVFQMTAPASRGSSGGPVLSLSGQVMGIAASQMQAGQNLNFAVPINYARGLLNNLGETPVATLRPTSSRDGDATVRLSADAIVVNEGLAFNLGDFSGYTLDTEARLGEERTRRTRISYRVIETVGQSGARLERYLESETTRRVEPFGTQQTVHRERVRTLVSLEDLEPLSTRGEAAWWTGEGWATATYDLAIESGRIQGLVTDTTGRTLELDRELPRGIVLREMRDLAFTSMAADSLVGKSVELVTFDAWSGSVVEDRYDVLDVTEVEAGGETYEALRVNVASGLANATAFFSVERPFALLRRVSGDGRETEELLRLGTDGNRPR